MAKKNIFIDSRPDEREMHESSDFGGGQRSFATIIGRVYRQNLRPHLSLLALAATSMIIVAVGTAALPLLLKWIADGIFVDRNENLLIVLPIVVIVITILRGIADYVARVSLAYLGERLVADTRQRMFERLIFADIAWLQHIHSGRFVAAFLNDAGMIRSTAAQTLNAIGQNLLKVTFLIGVMFYLDWRLTILLVIGLPLAAYLMGRQSRKVHRSAVLTMQETGDLSALIAQTLHGIRVVKAYGQEAVEAARVTDVIRRTFEHAMRAIRAQVISGPLTETLTGIGIAAAIFYGGYRGISGTMTFGSFVGFISSAMLIYDPLRALATLRTGVQQGIAAANRVFDIIDYRSSVTERPDARALQLERGAIKFDNVTFAYQNEAPVLHNFTLDIPAGTRVALVGPSGAGKTTALNLVMRFFDPGTGAILFDGQDIARATLASVRGASSLVTQDPIIFDDTVRANIAYGSNDASLEAIRQAAKAAAADAFITNMPQGYDTMLGESGNRLSGGERQRIAFARAIMRDTPIVLLDEPTSALDPGSEEKVRKAMRRLFARRTVLMIAHRLATVREADLICVMDKGRIVETGTHEELLKNGGLYATLYQSQADGFLGEEP